MDWNEALIGYVALNILRRRLRHDSLSKIIDVIKTRDMRSMRQLGIQTSSVSRDEGALETLRQMNETNLQYIAVVDHGNRIVGILERSDLTSKLLVQLIDEIEGVKIRRVKKEDDRNNK